MTISLLDVLQTVSLGGVAVGVWFLPRYLERRIAEAARGAVDLSVGKALAEHNYTLDQQRERSSKDYGLFAERRNEVYAETYSLFEKVRGEYARHFASLIERRDFSRSPEIDIRHLATKLTRISEGERENLTRALDVGELDAARRLANVLYERNELRRANDAFYKFKRAWVLHALYFSPVIDGILATAAETLGSLCVVANELIEENTSGPMISTADRRARSEKVKELDALSPILRYGMQAEMQSGFQSSGNKPISP